jgi:hypothetical protein
MVRMWRNYGFLSRSVETEDGGCPQSKLGADSRGSADKRTWKDKRMIPHGDRSWQRTTSWIRRMLVAAAVITAAPASGQTAGGWLDIRPHTVGDDPVQVERDKLPKDVSEMETQPQTPRAIQLYEASYQPRDFCAGARFMHKPLYFEDQQLERYGVSPGLLGHVPPLRAGAHFLGSFLLLPAKALKTPPHRMVPSACTCNWR